MGNKEILHLVKEHRCFIIKRENGWRLTDYHDTPELAEFYIRNYKRWWDENKYEIKKCY